MPYKETFMDHNTRARPHAGWQTGPDRAAEAER
jgi:hypothetical protein